VVLEIQNSCRLVLVFLNIAASEAVTNSTLALAQRREKMKAALPAATRAIIPHMISSVDTDAAKGSKLVLPIVRKSINAQQLAWLPLGQKKLSGFFNEISMSTFASALRFAKAYRVSRLVLQPLVDFGCALSVTGQVTSLLSENDLSTAFNEPNGVLHPDPFAFQREPREGRKNEAVGDRSAPDILYGVKRPTFTQ
jgi:hypothetical protein